VGRRTGNGLDHRYGITSKFCFTGPCYNECWHTVHWHTVG